ARLQPQLPNPPRRDRRRPGAGHASCFCGERDSTGFHVTSPETPALLCDATFYGTLAAVRSLGRAGVPVDVVDPGYAAVASWSRYATRRLRGPPVARADRLVRWLVELGARQGRDVAYPPSDE